MAIGPAEVFRTLLTAPYVTKRTRLYNILLFLVCLLGKFWFIILQCVGLAVLAPQPTENSFDDCFSRANILLQGVISKRLNSLIILGAWKIWKHSKRLCYQRGCPKRFSLSSSRKWGGLPFEFSLGQGAFIDYGPQLARLYVVGRESSWGALFFLRFLFMFCVFGLFVFASWTHLFFPNAMIRCSHAYSRK